MFDESPPNINHLFSNLEAIPLSNKNLIELGLSLPLFKIHNADFLHKVRKLFNYQINVQVCRGEEEI